MNNKLRLLYDDGAGDGIGGGGNDVGYSGGDTGFDSTIEPGADAPEPVEAPKPSFTADDLAKAVRAGVSDLVPKQQAPQAQPERPLTQAEYDRIFKRAIVTQDDMQKLGLPPEAVSTLQAILDRQAAHADTLAQYQAYQLKNNLESRFNTFYKEQFTPIQVERIQVAEQKLEKDFFSVHADLQPFRPLCVEVKNAMVAEGQKFNDAQSAFNALAGRVRGVLKAIPGYAGNAQQGQPGQVNGTTNPRRMTPVSTGGQVGSAGKGGSANTTTAANIFG